MLLLQLFQCSSWPNTQLRSTQQAALLVQLLSLSTQPWSMGTQPWSKPAPAAAAWMCHTSSLGIPVTKTCIKHQRPCNIALGSHMLCPTQQFLIPYSLHVLFLYTGLARCRQRARGHQVQHLPADPRPILQPQGHLSTTKAMQQIRSRPLHFIYLSRAPGSRHPLYSSEPLWPLRGNRGQVCK